MPFWQIISKQNRPVVVADGSPLKQRPCNGLWSKFMSICNCLVHLWACLVDETARNDLSRFGAECDTPICILPIPRINFLDGHVRAMASAKLEEVSHEHELLAGRKQGIAIAREPKVDAVCETCSAQVHRFPRTVSQFQKFGIPFFQRFSV